MTKELHWIWEPDDQIWSNDFTCGRKTVWGFFLVLFLPNWWRLQKIVYHSCSWASHFSIHSQSANIWQRNTLTQLKREDAMGLCMCVCVCVFMCVHSTNKSNHKAVKVVMRWNLGSGNHNRQRSDDVWHKTRMHTCAYTLTQTDTHTHTHTQTCAHNHRTVAPSITPLLTSQVTVCVFVLLSVCLLLLRLSCGKCCEAKLRMNYFLWYAIQRWEWICQFSINDTSAPLTALQTEGEGGIQRERKRSGSTQGPSKYFYGGVNRLLSLKLKADILHRWGDWMCRQLGA